MLSGTETVVLQPLVQARYNAFVATVLDPALITDVLAFYR